MKTPAWWTAAARLRLLMLAAAAVAWLAIAWPGAGLLRQADERGSDWVWQLGARDATERRVVVVDIDDASLQRIGPWPWPRETQAKLVQALTAQGAALQLYDIVFADAREGTEKLAQALAAAGRESPSVLGEVFALNRESFQASGELAGALPGTACSPAAAHATGYVANVPGLGAAAGHITPRIDPDGSVRRMPALVCFGDRNYPALALAGLIALQEPSPTPLRAQPGSGPWAPAWSLSIPGMPEVNLPLDRNGDIRVPYLNSRKSFISVSAADLLEGKVESGMLRGAWVVVGTSAFGLGDTVPTALGGAVSGVEVHAQLLTALLDGAVPYEPQAASALSLAWALAAIAVLLVLARTRRLTGDGLSGRRVLWVPVAAVVLAGAGWALHAALLLGAGWWVGWSQAALAIVLAGLALGGAEHARSLAERGRLFRNLASYLPRTVAERVAQTEPSGQIVAQRRDVTVVVADIRNFSAFCESRAPEDAAKVLHRFYTTASEIVQAHGGVIEEVVGDSLVAVFNGSLPCDDHPMKALAAARDVWLRCTEELPNLPGQGLEPLALGVGMETGTALVGSFGPSERRVHSVLGQTVTMALRLCDMCTDLACPVLVGPESAERVGIPFDNSELALKPLGSFLLSGLRHSSRIFTLRALMQPGGDAEQQSIRYLRDHAA